MDSCLAHRRPRLTPTWGRRPWLHAAAAVIFAVGIPVQKRDRFAGKTIIEVGVQDAIKKPDEILAKIKADLGG